MDGENFMENLSGRDVYSFISSHINDLLSVKNSLNENIFRELENSWDKYAYTNHLNDNEYLAWRGAKVRVINAEKGINNKIVKDVIKYDIGFDEPCPTRYPRLLSGLMMRIHEEFSYYYIHVNKYMFYENIARVSYALEKRSKDLTKTEMCDAVLSEQVKLLTEWKKDFANQMYFERLNNISNQNHTFYFAYGANCNNKKMLARCPNAQKVGESILHDYQFIIDDRGKNGGCASVKKRTGSSVTGILWRIPNQEIETLDRAEGVNMSSPAYKKEYLNVQVLGTNCFDFKSLVYVSMRKEGFYARDNYIELILDGLKENLVTDFDEKSYKAHIKLT